MEIEFSRNNERYQFIKWGMQARNQTEDLHSTARQATIENRVHYERHRPEETTLYQLMQKNVETFFAQVETETGSGLPDFVKDEFDAFLECGILAHGFLRLRCTDCSHEKLVAFSCKRRGFCPSCGGRRMAQTAAHLVDHVILNVSVVRQWVLSLPIPLRILLAAHPYLLSPVLQIISRAISAFLIKQAGFKRRDAQTGAVTLIIRISRTRAGARKRYQSAYDVKSRDSSKKHLYDH